MAKLKILVVDDAAFIRDLVKKAVKETYPGCELFEAIDGRKAISIMNAQDINLVLCDWEMPECSGIEVLQVPPIIAHIPRGPYQGTGWYKGKV